jgi:hypothetical protein
MGKKTILILLPALFLFSCLKENLDPVNIKKVVMLQVDYKTYKFEGGKEFAYFENDTSTVYLPLHVDYTPAAPDGRLTVRYTEDTIFDGTTVWQGTGVVNYPH